MASLLEKPIVFNGFTLNNKAVRDALRSTAPYYDFWVRKTDGLFGGRQINQGEYNIPRKLGDYAINSDVGGQRITLSGVLKARNLQYLRAGGRAFEQALWDGGYHQLRFQLWNEPQLYYNARVSQDLVMSEEQQNGTIWQRVFTVQFYAADPRTYRVSDGSVYPAWRT